MKILFIYQNPERMPLPVAPLGMLTVAAAASHAGHIVTALDLSTSPNPSAEIKQRVTSFAPDAVGVSIRVLTQAYSGEPGRRIHHIDGAKTLVEFVRATTSAPIILGGPGFSHAPVEVFRFLEPDYGIEGEGERSLPALLSALSAKDSPEHIPGLLWWGDAGELRRNPPELIEDLDSLPVQDPGLINYRQYLGRGAYVSINTSRGCNRQCIFCDDPKKAGPRVRTRSAEKVADEIAFIKAQHGYRHYYMADSNFTGARGHAAALCEALLRRNIRIHWQAEPNPGELSEELVALMKRAGCGGVWLGVDSGSEQMLKNYKKGFSQTQIAEAARWCGKYRLPLLFTVLVGGPGETPDTFQESVKFFEEIDTPDMIFFGLGIDVYRGTRMLEIAAAEGALPDRPDFLRGVDYISPAVGRRFIREISRACAAHPGWASEGFIASRACAAYQRFSARIGLRPTWKGASRKEAILSKIPGLRLPKG